MFNVKDIINFFRRKREDNAEAIQETASRTNQGTTSIPRSNYRISNSKCICGCNGKPLTQLPPYSIDYSLYNNCPARLERKHREGRIKAAAKVESKEKKQREQAQSKLRDLAERQENERLKATEESGRASKGLPALSAAEAIRRGLRTFSGSPCKRGHSGERDAGSGECVTCRAFDKKRRDAMRRGAFPHNLSEEERKEIVSIYDAAKALSKSTGIQHHVDHIRPLAAGGDHRPDNLQILTAKENLTKGAKWDGAVKRRLGKERKSS